MGRVIRNAGDNHKAKKYIDAFFELAYDNKSLEFFSTANRIMELDVYLSTGKKPFYMDKPDAIKKQAETSEQKSSGMSPAEFLRRIREGDSQ